MNTLRIPQAATSDSLQNVGFTHSERAKATELKSTGNLDATPTYISPWKDFTAGLRDLFLTWRKTWLLLMSNNGPNGRLCLFIINQPFLSVFIKLYTIGYLSH